jgi:hypothetical protein
MLDYATIIHPVLVETVKRVRDLLKAKIRFYINHLVKKNYKHQ